MCRWINEIFFLYNSIAILEKSYIGLKVWELEQVGILPYRLLWRAIIKYKLFKILLVKLLRNDIHDLHGRKHQNMEIKEECLSNLWTLYSYEALGNCRENIQILWLKRGIRNRWFIRGKCQILAFHLYFQPARGMIDIKVCASYLVFCVLFLQKAIKLL